MKEISTNHKKILQDALNTNSLETFISALNNVCRGIPNGMTIVAFFIAYKCSDDVKKEVSDGHIEIKIDTTSNSKLIDVKSNEYEK